MRVLIDPVKKLIQPTGWSKKALADLKIDLDGLCESNCGYCSSNSNLWHQFNKRSHAEAVTAQTGTGATPFTPGLSYRFPDPVAQLRKELEGKPRNYGDGKTIAFGCLVDNLGTSLVKSGIARACLELLVARTMLRIRVTTKNEVVGREEWIRFFLAHAGRFVINLSIGTVDDEWARKIERDTSKPTARIRAMRRLQDAGVPTGGMICPVFPQAVKDIEEILTAIRPQRCEMVWAEPYNDRTNWTRVTGDQQTEVDLANMFGHKKDPNAWSAYAVDLYKRLRLRADADGWTDKLAYMLYESSMEASYARTFADLRGVLLQSVDKNGRSKHPVFAGLQDRLKITRHELIAYDGPESNDWTDPQDEEVARWEALMAGSAS